MHVLDGPMGTALMAAGETLDATAGSAPLVHSRAAAVRRVHQSYLDAGATHVRTNTFMAAHTQEPLSVARAAVALARDAGAPADGLIGDLGPFSADGRAPPDCVASHGALALELRKSGCETLLVETLRTRSEVLAAAGLAADLGGTWWISVVPADGHTSLGKAALTELAAHVLRLPDVIFGLNCAEPAIIEAALSELQANGVDLSRVAAWPSAPATTTQKLGPTLAGWASRWPELHALGGCCGAEASDIETLARACAASH